MKIFQHKKASEYVFAIIVVVAIFIIFSKIVDLANRECSHDSDCNSDSYCGSDFRCHKFPVITQVTYIPAAMIVGACILAAAFLLRKKLSHGQGGGN